MPVLSTGQTHRPELGRKLRLFTNPKFIGKSMKGVASRAVGATVAKAREGAAFGAGSVLDSFVGNWAGDWARSKAYKDESDEKKLKVTDYIKIFRSEVADLLGRYDHGADRQAQVDKNKVGEESKKKKPTSNAPATTVIPQQQGMPALGVNSKNDLEHLITEMKRTSEDELLKYIEKNDIKDEKLIHDLIEATYAANNEVEQGLRKQFKIESGNSSTLERIAASTEGMHQEIVKQSQDIYKGTGSGLSPLAQTVLNPAAKKEGGMGGGLLDSAKGLFSGGAKILGSLTSGLMGGKIGKFIKGAGLTAAATMAGGTLIDSGLGALGVGKDSEGKDIQLNTKQDDKNWDKMSTFQKVESGMARGVEKVGRFFGLDNMANEAAQKRIETETKYLEANPKSSSQQASSDELQSESSKLSKNKDSQSSPTIISAPTNVAGGNSGTSKEIFNFGSQNTENTHRRLNDKSLSLAYI